MRPPCSSHSAQYISISYNGSRLPFLVASSTLTLTYPVLNTSLSEAAFRYYKSYVDVPGSSRP